MRTAEVRVATTSVVGGDESTGDRDGETTEQILELLRRLDAERSSKAEIVPALRAL